MDRVLVIQGLKVGFSSFDGQFTAVRGVNLTVNRGETVAIVGESGSGKSVTAHAVMRLLKEPSARITEGKILFNNRDLSLATQKEMQEIRGREISIIFQDAINCLNPTLKIGRQIEEVFIKHKKLSVSEARRQSADLLDSVGITLPHKRLEQYPHELSGGMRQRVMIAIAVACNPQLLIADEPTTSVDVTSQAQIIEIMKDLQNKNGTAVLLITHNFGIISGFCNRIAVMYAGQLVETGLAGDIFYNPAHPYTDGLLKSVPRIAGADEQGLTLIPGHPPNSTELPSGCSFWPRCGQAMKICVQQEPPVVEISKDHSVRCWLHFKQRGVCQGE